MTKPYNVFLITFILTAILFLLVFSSWLQLAVAAGIVVGVWAGWLLDKK